MAVYIVTLVSVTALAWVAHQHYARSTPFPIVRKWQGDIAMVLAFLILFLVSALRYEVGADYGSYKQYWTVEGVSWEKGYLTLVQLSRWITPSFEFFIALNSFIVIALFCSAYRKNIQFHPIAVFLFMAMGTYFITFCLLRQAISMALIFWAYPLLCNKKYVHFSCIIILAACFHTSVLLVAPAFLLVHIRLSKRQYIIGLFIGAMFGFVLQGVVKWYIHQRYSGYHDEEMDPMMALYSLLLGGILFSLCWIYRTRLLHRKTDNHVLWNLTYFYVIYSFCFPFVPVTSRVMQYFIPFLGMTITEIVSCQEKVQIKRLYIIVILLGYSVFLFILVRVSNMGVFPYQTLFSK